MKGERRRTGRGFRLSLWLFLVLAAVGLVGAYQWPVSDPKVVKNFASPREGEFFAGLRLAVAGQGGGLPVMQLESPLGGGAGPRSDRDPSLVSPRDVRPVDQGEILFRQEAGYREMPFSGGGSMTVIHHRGGLRSFYAGLDLAGDLSDSGSVSPYSILGRPASGEDVFSFFLYDTQRKRFVNPFLVLPSFRDEEPPQISGLVLENGEGKTYPLRGDLLTRDSYRLRGRVSDLVGRGSAGTATVPYAVSLFLNGNNVRTVTFDALQARDGDWELASLEEGRYSDVYGAEGSFVLGDIRLNTGRNILEVILRDIAGNETVRTYRIEVR